MIRNIICITLLSISLSSVGQSQNEESLFSAPDDWLTERLEFPLSFAPSIDIVGFEDLKFAPKWSDTTSQEFWTYTFVWYNEKATNLSEGYLSDVMEMYFDGLMGIDMKRKEGLDKPEKTKSIFMSTEEGFIGKIETFDAFFTKKELSLYVRVNEVFCADTFKQFVLFKLSLKRLHHDTWKLFDSVQLNVDCK